MAETQSLPLLLRLKASNHRWKDREEDLNALRELVRQLAAAGAAPGATEGGGGGGAAGLLAGHFQRGIILDWIYTFLCKTAKSQEHVIAHQDLRAITAALRVVVLGSSNSDGRAVVFPTSVDHAIVKLLTSTIESLSRQLTTHGQECKDAQQGLRTCLEFMSLVYAGFSTSGDLLLSAFAASSGKLNVMGRQRRGRSAQQGFASPSTRSLSHPTVAAVAQFAASILSTVHDAIGELADGALAATYHAQAHMESNSGSQLGASVSKLCISKPGRLVEVLLIVEEVLRVYLGVFDQNRGAHKTAFQSLTQTLLGPLLSMTAPFCFLVTPFHSSSDTKGDATKSVLVHQSEIDEALSGGGEAGASRLASDNVSNTNVTRHQQRHHRSQERVVAAQRRVRILIEALVSEILFTRESCESMHAACQIFLRELFQGTEFKGPQSRRGRGAVVVTSAAEKVSGDDRYLVAVNAVLQSKNAAKNYGFALLESMHRACSTSGAARRVLGPLLLRQFFRSCRMHPELGYTASGARRSAQPATDVLSASSNSAGAKQKKKKHWWTVLPYQFSIFLFMYALAKKATKSCEAAAPRPNAINAAISCSLCRHHAPAILLSEMRHQGIYQPHVDTRRRFFAILRFELDSTIMGQRAASSNSLTSPHNSQTASQVLQLTRADSCLRVAREILEMEHLLFVNEEDNDDDEPASDTNDRAEESSPAQEGRIKGSAVEADIMFPVLQRALKIMLATANLTPSDTAPLSGKKSSKRKQAGSTSVAKSTREDFQQCSALGTFKDPVLTQSVQLVKDAFRDFCASSLRTYAMLRRITYWFEFQLQLEKQVSAWWSTSLRFGGSTSDSSTAGKLLAELLVWDRPAEFADGFVSAPLVLALHSVPTAQIEEVLRFLAQLPTRDRQALRAASSQAANIGDSSVPHGPQAQPSRAFDHVVTFKLPNSEVSYDLERTEAGLVDVLTSRPAHSAAKSSAMPLDDARRLASTLISRLEKGELALAALQARLRQQCAGRILEIDSYVVQHGTGVAGATDTGAAKSLRNLQHLLGGSSAASTQSNVSNVYRHESVAVSSPANEKGRLTANAEAPARAVSMSTLRRYFIEAFLVHCPLTIQNAQSLVNAAGELALSVDAQTQHELPSCFGGLSSDNSVEVSADSPLVQLHAVPWNLLGLWCSLQKFSDRCCHFANVRFQPNNGGSGDAPSAQECATGRLQVNIERILQQTSSILTGSKRAGLSSESNGVHASQLVEAEVVVTLLRVAACQLNLCVRGVAADGHSTSAQGLPSVDHRETQALADEIVRLTLQERIGWVVVAENADALLSCASPKQVRRLLRWIFTPASISLLRLGADEASMARRCLLNNSAFYEIPAVCDQAPVVLQQLLEELVRAYVAARFAEGQGKHDIAQKLQSVLEISANMPPGFLCQKQDNPRLSDTGDAEEDPSFSQWLRCLLQFEGVMSDTTFIYSHMWRKKLSQPSSHNPKTPVGQPAKKKKKPANTSTTPLGAKAAVETTIAEPSSVQLDEDSQMMYKLLVSARRSLATNARDQPRDFLAAVFADTDDVGRSATLHRFTTHIEHGIFGHSRQIGAESSHTEFSWQLLVSCFTKSFYAEGLSLLQSPEPSPKPSVGVVIREERHIGSYFKDLAQHVMCIADDFDEACAENGNQSESSSPDRVGAERRLWRSLQLSAAAASAVASVIQDTLRDRAWGRKTDSVGTGGVNTHFAGDGNPGPANLNGNSKRDLVDPHDTAEGGSFAFNRRACSAVAKALSGFDGIAVQLARYFREKTATPDFSWADANLTSAFASYVGFCASILNLHRALQQIRSEQCLSLKRTAVPFEAGGPPPAHKKSPRQVRNVKSTKSFSIEPLQTATCLSFLVQQITKFVDTGNHSGTDVAGTSTTAFVNNCIADFVVSLCTLVAAVNSADSSSSKVAAAAVNAIPFSDVLFLAWIALSLENQSSKTARTRGRHPSGTMSQVSYHRRQRHHHSRTVVATMSLVSDASPEDLASALQFVQQKCLAAIHQQRQKRKTSSLSVATMAQSAASLQLLRFLCSCRGSWWAKAHGDVVALVLRVAGHTVASRAIHGREVSIWEVLVVQDMMTALLSRERSVILTSTDVATFLRLNQEVLMLELGEGQRVAQRRVSPAAHRVFAPAMSVTADQRRAVVDASCAVVLAILRHRPRNLMHVVTCFVDFLRFLMRTVLVPPTAAAAIVSAASAAAAAGAAKNSANESLAGRTGSSLGLQPIVQVSEYSSAERTYLAESWSRVVAAASDLKHAVRRFYSFLVAEYISISLYRDSNRNVHDRSSAQSGPSLAAEEHSVDAAMQEGVFGLLDALTKHELQSLYVSMSAPAAVALKTLHHKYVRDHKFSGKV